MTKKIICVWIGTFESKEKLYNDYLSFRYDGEDESEFGKDKEGGSKFGKDAGLAYYDEDFMESWWFNKLELNALIENMKDLLDSEYFFDELRITLQSLNLTNRNSISFLYGENGKNSTNESLFKYNGMKSENKPIEFVFQKEYEKK